MFVQTTWGEAAFKNTVVGYAFIYGGLLQLLAGLFEVSHRVRPAACLCRKKERKKEMAHQP